ncbi:MAG: AAA family ATPase [Nanoarchaeota archaeon]
MSQSEIWTEKYRPAIFDDVVGQSEIVKRASALVQAMNIPHIMFAGPSGTGKSTLALIIVKELFKDKWKENYLELNASDERGIDVVRQKVKDFARTKSIGIVPFKVIFLDEADALTQEAQQALRRTMENYTNTCRFIMSCVTPDTKIVLPEEIEITIDEFMKKFEDKTLSKVQNFNGNTSKEDLVLATVRLNPKIIGKKTLEITTMTGRKLKVTEDHKLFTDKGWMEAGKIAKSDKVLIYPHLEGTSLEDNTTKLIDVQQFVKFLSEREEREGLETISEGAVYRNLKTEEKNKIIKRVKELNLLIISDKGLTLREKEIYDIIKDKKDISRRKIEKIIGISRIRTAQLLKSIENKGYITRYIGKNKNHHFIIKNQNPEIIRNLMDICIAIEKEFKIKISYTSIKNAFNDSLNHGSIDRIIGELKRKNLIDLDYNSQQIGALTRIAAFMFGDGHIVKNDIRMYFSGNRKALEEVKKDLIILGYENFSNTFDKEVISKIGDRRVEGVSTAFYLDSRPLSILLQYLGVPKGDKVTREYSLPSFVRDGTKFVKREFLRSLFGCEADKPRCKRYNFSTLSLRQNKVTKLKNSMVEFYNELINLLKTFGVNSYLLIRDLKEKRTKDNKEVLTFVLRINSYDENLQKFFSRVGYAYEEYKQRLSRLSSEYLKHKLFAIKMLQDKTKLIEIASFNGQSHRAIASSLSVSKDFVAFQLKGKDVHVPRNSFLQFEDWINKYEKGSFVENEIIDITEIQAEDVRDITCFKDHNFIANGFLSHNCNYSSKIIDPIQSRCVVFRFKLLEKKDIVSVIKKITEKEKLKITDDALETLYEMSEGDCRRAINLLQATASIALDINAEIVKMIASSAKPTNVKIVLDYALAGDFLNAREKLLDIMLKESVGGTDIIKAIQKEIWNLQIEPQIKVKLTEKTGEAEFRIVEGSDEFVQLQALLASFVLAGSKEDI